MTKNTVSVLVMASIMVLVLVSLGVWQWKRMAWKEGILAQIEQNGQAEPIGLSAVIEKVKGAIGGLNKAEYSHVRLTGEYDHSRQLYFFGQQKGRVGWFLYTPLEYKTGFFVFVNRGFFPGNRPEASAKGLPLPNGKVEVVGLLRMGLEKKPSRFTPKNNTEKKEYFWRSLRDMTLGSFGGKAVLSSINSSSIHSREGSTGYQVVLPFSIDLERKDHAGKWPMAGTTILKPANSHFTYMMTWFSFAITLLIITGLYLAGQGRKE